MSLFDLTGPLTGPRVRRRLAHASESVAVRGKRLRHALGLPSLLAGVAIMFAEIVGLELQILLPHQSSILAALGVLAVAAALIAYRWSAQIPGVVTATAYGNPGTEKLPARRGLVLLVGLDSASPSAASAALFAAARAAEYVAFIGTPETAATGVVDEVIGRILPAVGVHLPGTRIRRWEHGHAESVADTEESTSEALRWMLGRGLDPSEIVVDVSAGRRAMGYGAKDAADAVLVETQYLASQWDTVTNRPIAGSNAFKVIKTYHA